MLIPYIFEASDGAITIEWRTDNALFTISIEKDLDKSSWCYVDKYHNVETKLLPEEMIDYFRKVFE